MIFCEIRTKNTSCSVQASAPAISKICCCWSSSYPTPPVAPTSSATTTTREALPRLTFQAVRMSGRIAGAIITRNSLIRVGRKLNTISIRSRDIAQGAQHLRRKCRQRGHHHDDEDAKLDAV